MRNLHIIRRKSFVACVNSVRIFIQSAYGDTYINGVCCQFLCRVKNGETATVQINDDAANIYAIYDKLSKDYCSDCYPLSYGTEDVYVSGKAHFNPVTGNPFYFDGVTNPEILANRKKGQKKGALFFVLGIVLGISVGLAFALFRILTMI